MKLRPIFYILLFLTSGQLSFSQNPTINEKFIDSTYQATLNYTKEDSVKVELLNKLSAKYVTEDLEKADSILLLALKISEKIEYQQGLANTYTNFSSLFVRKGEYDKAVDAINQAKIIQAKLNDDEGIIYANQNLARIYIDLNELEKAREILEENNELLSNEPNSNLKASNHFYLANTYSALNKVDKTIENYLAARSIAEHNNFQTGINIANASLGGIEIERRNFNKALEYLLPALKSFQQMGQTVNVAYSYQSLAKAYLGLENTSSAIASIDKAIEIFKDQELYKNLKDAYDLKTQISLKDKNYTEAMEALQLKYAIQDSILSIEKTKAIKEYQIKYETEKTEREKEAALKTAQLNALERDRNQKLFIGTAIIAGLLILSGIFLYSRFREKKKAELITMELKETQKRLALEMQYRQSELKALKAQMDPHFIFNALNSIQEYIILNQKNLASDYLGKFAGLMRKYLHHSDKGLISIREEIDCLNIYLELEEVRFEDSFKYNITVDKAVNQELYHIPTMIVQPYVENALKHGLLHKKEDRKLTITIQEVNNKIECIIVDNGIGREKAAQLKKNRLDNHQSFATQATESRLELLNYGKEQKIGVSTVDLYDEDKNASGTKVTLTIPYFKK